MAELRPKNMKQGEFAELLRRNGFPACSKAAVSLAERPKETGVQFTPEARETAQRLLNSARRPEKRVNPNKTTVWLDDELREWVQTQAYLWDLPVGDVIRRILKEAKDRTWRADVGIGPYEEEKAASDAATSEAAGAPETSGQARLVPTGRLQYNTFWEVLQDERNQNHKAGPSEFQGLRRAGPGPGWEERQHLRRQRHRQDHRL